MIYLENHQLLLSGNKMKKDKENQYKKWSHDELVNEIIRLQSKKKFGLVWDQKDENIIQDCVQNYPTLVEKKTKRINSDQDKNHNFLIEGDNFHSLYTLSFTHKNKIDIIYIDPPYNTGARDWKYNNDYVDSEDPYRHSKWLSMMYSRLYLAKNLLKDDGVLICTIDFNEQERLGLLLEDLFVSYEIKCITIVHNPSGTQGLNFSNSNEYAYFVFPKGGKYIADEIRDKGTVSPFRDWGDETSLREGGKNCFYPIYVKDNKILDFGDVCEDDFKPSANETNKEGITAVYPIDNSGTERKWRFARQSVEEIKDELFCQNNKDTNFIEIKRNKNKYNYKTVWDSPKFFANNHGTQLLNRILKDKFPYPKSLYAVMECIKAAEYNKKDALILDFFAGSGTTGHAVLELNKLDNQNRNFILCTNNENKICSNITYPRLKKVINGYKDLKDGKSIKGIKANLVYLKEKFTKKDNTDSEKRNLAEEMIPLICLKEDAYDEIKSNRSYYFYEGKKNNIGILLDFEKLPHFKDFISNSKKTFILYIFSLSEDDFQDEFRDIKNIDKIISIPDSLISLYRRLEKNDYS